MIQNNRITTSSIPTGRRVYPTFHKMKLLICILVAVTVSVKQPGEATLVPDGDKKRAAGINDTREAMSTLPQPTPSPVQPCVGTEADIVVALHSSTGVTESNFRLELAFLMDLVKKINVESSALRLGVLTFSTNVHIHFHLNDYRTEDTIIDAILHIPYNQGSTNIADAIRTMRTEMFTEKYGGRPDVEKIGILLTSRVSNIEAKQTIPEADEARRAGITMYAIGIGIEDTRELDGIASRPLEKYRLNVKDFESLQDIEKQLIKSLCVGE